MRGRRRACGQYRVFRAVFWPTSMPTLGFSLRLALGHSAAAILVIFSGDSSEHVEHHDFDRAEHAGGELIGLRRGIHARLLSSLDRPVSTTHSPCHRCWIGAL